jgi:hypothetical protein
MQKKKLHPQFWSDNLKGTEYLQDTGIERKIILNCIIRKIGERMWMGFI